MPASRFIDIDGKRFVWRELLQRRREQLAAAARVEQPALFELKEDCRSIPERIAAGGYSEPSLFAVIEREGKAGDVSSPAAWLIGFAWWLASPGRCERLSVVSTSPPALSSGHILLTTVPSSRLMVD